MNLLKNFLSRENDYFSKNEDYVARKNRYSLYRISLCATVLFLLFLLLAPAVYPHFKPGREYFIGLALFVLFFLIGCYLRKRNDLNLRKVQCICTFFYVYIPLIMILIEAFPVRNKQVLYFPVIIAVLPAIFIMRLESYFILTFLMEALFILCEITRKPPDIWRDNLFISIVGSVFALIIGWILLETRIEDGVDKSLLVQKSQMDHLTGVKNKVTCEHEILHFLAQKNPEQLSACFLLDIDQFKNINDQFGHQCGDEILSRFGALLNQHFRANDIIGRTGGDEFTVFIKDLTHVDATNHKCEQILTSVRDILLPDGSSLSCSIGVAVCQSSDFTSISKLADDAMYEAKMLGKDQYVRFLEHNLSIAATRQVMLIADDNEINRATIRSCFESKYECIEAADGRETLSLLSQYSSQIAILLLDIYMPHMDGYDVLKFMQSKPQYSDIPVIVITADKESEENALKYGAVDMITKPINPTVLKLRVKKVLS